MMATMEMQTLIDSLNNIADILKNMATRPYTLTGAQDWYLFMTMTGIVIGLLVYIWQDLKGTMKEHRSELQTALEKEARQREKDIDAIWQAMRACQEDCCPRTKVLPNPRG